MCKNRLCFLLVYREIAVVNYESDQNHSGLSERR